ncbi:MAG: histidine--tRNA ligase [Actinobacteria bacterium]|nr:histidine--tRNA ligase [Actinomycetota bacterium]
MNVNAPRGTIDIFGEDIKYRNFIIDTARELFSVFNYQEIVTPTFEYTEVFTRSIGEGTDIVQKEMYTFEDKKGRSLTLRPEGTASVVRAFVENKMFQEHLPVKLFYIGSMFRYERPQKGRMREFSQLGVESIGTNNPMMDVEVIWLLNSLFKELGFVDLVLLINSIGCSNCRESFVEDFKAFILPHLEKLCPDCRKRYTQNPLRIFDCKNRHCRKVLEGSPRVLSYLCTDCREHFEKVLGYLDVLKIKYRIDHSLVRGFDYYTQTIFEIVSYQIESAQNALGGGGRYNNLVEQFGGPSLPAVGFAVGIDRTLMLLKKLCIEVNLNENRPRIYLIVLDEEYSSYCLEILQYLREHSYTCDTNYNAKKLGTELKWAEKGGYDFSIIVGEDEVKTHNITVKDMKTRNQYRIDWSTGKKEILTLLSRDTSPSRR